MRLIPRENVKKFISELENIFYALVVDDETWRKYNTISDLYLGTDIKNMDDTTEEIAIIWHIDDVKSIRPELTDEQAMTVLESAKENHDANEGINWDTLDIVADCLFPIDVSKTV